MLCFISCGVTWGGYRGVRVCLWDVDGGCWIVVDVVVGVIRDGWVKGQRRFLVEVRGEISDIYIHIHIHIHSYPFQEILILILTPTVLLRYKATRHTSLESHNRRETSQDHAAETRSCSSRISRTSLPSCSSADWTPPICMSAARIRYSHRTVTILYSA